MKRKYTDDELEFFKTLLFVSAAILLTLLFCVSARAEEIPEFDITEPCSLSTDGLSAVLKYDLKDYAEEFLQAEEDYGINALFLASIAAHESGWGRYQFRENNIFGYGQMEFEDIPNCIDYVAWRISKDYIQPSGKYHSGATVEGIAENYCDEDWVGYIKGIWKSLATKSKEA